MGSQIKVEQSTLNEPQLQHDGVNMNYSVQTGIWCLVHQSVKPDISHTGTAIISGCGKQEVDDMTGDQVTCLQWFRNLSGL